ncbi:MAG: hypothetical protein ACLFVJ_22630 [Persicimonas sp.]
MTHDEIAQMGGREVDRRVAELRGVVPDDADDRVERAWPTYHRNDAVAAELRREMAEGIRPAQLMVLHTADGDVRVDLGSHGYGDGADEADATARAYLYWKGRQ